jgi:hypothetical protein
MKTLLKATLLASAMFTAASVSAAPIAISISYAPTAEADFLASLNGPTVTENFDGLGGAQVIGADAHHSWENKSSSILTNVGTFTLTAAGQIEDGNIHNDELMIESNVTGEDGRETLSNGSATDFWLDSNDAETVIWSFGAPLSGSFNAFGFYLADPSDVSANLTLTFDDGTSSSNITTFFELANGNLGYVTVISEQNIVGATLTFSNTTKNDGWGIDDVTVGNVPEPGSILLMGLGLLGLGAARRRIKA